MRSSYNNAALSVKNEPETAYLSNNIILANYDSRDPTINQLIRGASSIFSEALVSSPDELFGDTVELKPYMIDSRKYPMSKIRLCDKVRKLHEATINISSGIPGMPPKTGGYHIFSYWEDVKETPYIKLTIDPNIIPVMRYIGQSAEQKSIGMTKLNLFKLSCLRGSYASRIAELLEYMQQNLIPKGNVIATVPLSWLIEKLGIPASYNRPAILRGRIFTPALREIYEKHRKGIDITFLNAEQMPCINKMKAEYVQFFLYCSPSNIGYFPEIKFVSEQMRTLGFEEQAVQDAVYMMRIPSRRKELAAQMKYYIETIGNYPLRIKRALAKDISEMEKIRD